MAAAWVGDGLVQQARHCCCPTALAMGDHGMPGASSISGSPSYPVLPCLAWSVSGAKATIFRAFLCIAQHSKPLVLAGTSQVLKEKKYVNREPW